MQPDYQRGEVWSEAKKKKLIDTILRGWLIPPIHVIPTKDYIDEVLDGQQRLVAIRDFFNGKFCIDGSIQPYDQRINGYDGYYYNELPNEEKRRLNSYILTFVSLMEYKPEEPAELFNRLNQPASLTAAEKRNAYIGRTRDQIKGLVSEFEMLGATKELVGFSNSRLAYDEVISKFAYMVEINTLKKKVTAGDISKKYQFDDLYNEITLQEVSETLCKYVQVMKELVEYQGFRPKMSKATIISWWLYIYKNPDLNSEEIGNVLSRFEWLRDHFKNNRTENQHVDNYLIKLQEKYPFIDAMMTIYTQRASMGSTDALSIIYRDIIIALFSSLITDRNKELLNIASEKYYETKNINAVLENINTVYEWGRTIR